MCTYTCTCVRMCIDCVGVWQRCVVGRIADHLRIGSRVNTLPCYDALARTMHTTVEYDTHDIVCTVKLKKKLRIPFALTEMVIESKCMYIILTRACDI